MKTKTFLRNALVSTLLLTSSYSVFANNHSSQHHIAPLTASQAVNSGEIIGDFNSPDGMVVGATLPGKNVSFKVPVEGNKPQYLHFAFMHAASGQHGWYFAPKSEYGIHLTTLKSGKTKDITNEIGLFQAPNAQTSSPVTANAHQLTVGAANKFMKATITQKDGFYIINITNSSAGDYATPFSSGVWSVTNQKAKAFDHTASAALSTLATSGHRAPLYQVVQGK